MLVRIERGSSVPISRQIADQIRAACLSGSAPVGYRMPSVRELARELGVNQNTILRIYEWLTTEGLLERRHGDGTYVCDNGTSKKVAIQKQQIIDELSAQIRRALMLGVEPRELSRLIDQVIRESVSDQAKS